MLNLKRKKSQKLQKAVIKVNNQNTIIGLNLRFKKLLDYNHDDFRNQINVYDEIHKQLKIEIQEQREKQKIRQSQDFKLQNKNLLKKWKRVVLYVKICGLMKQLINDNFYNEEQNFQLYKQDLNKEKKNLKNPIIKQKNLNFAQKMLRLNRRFKIFQEYYYLLNIILIPYTAFILPYCQTLNSQGENMQMLDLIYSIFLSIYLVVIIMKKKLRYYDYLNDEPCKIINKPFQQIFFTIIFLITVIPNYYLINNYDWTKQQRNRLLILQWTKLLHLKIFTTDKLTFFTKTRLYIKLKLKIEKFLAIISICFVLNLCTSFILFSSNLRDFESNSFSSLNFTHSDLTNSPYNYIQQLYWVVQTLTTVGYGDMTNVEHIEDRIFIIIFLIFGVAVYTNYLSSLSNYFVQGKGKEHILQQKITSVDSYSQISYISPTVLKHLNESLEFNAKFIFVYQKDEISNFMEQFPQNTKKQVLQISNPSLFKNNFFQNKDENFIVEFTMLMLPRMYLQGEFILKKGQYFNGIYFLNSGRVIMVNKYNIAYKQLQQHSYFGEIEYFLDNALLKGRQFNAVSKYDCSLMKIDSDKFDLMMNKYSKCRDQLHDIALKRYELYKQSKKDVKYLNKLKPNSQFWQISTKNIYDQIKLVNKPISLKEKIDLQKKQLHSAEKQYKFSMDSVREEHQMSQSNINYTQKESIQKSTYFEHINDQIKKTENNITKLDKNLSSLNTKLEKLISYIS